MGSIRGEADLLVVDLGQAIEGGIEYGGQATEFVPAAVQGDAPGMMAGGNALRRRGDRSGPT